MAQNQRRKKNNNPEGRNQYSGGVMDIARERPITAATVAAAAVGAGVFLWSRRSQISEQLSQISDQIGDWTQNMSSSGSGFDQPDDTGGLTSASSASSGFTDRASSSASRSSRGTGSRTPGMSETGGGNASLGAHSGGGGTSTAPSGRGRSGSSSIG